MTIDLKEKVNGKNIGKLVVARAVFGDEDLMVVTTKGIVIRTPISEIRLTGRVAKGVKVITVEEGSKVASTAIIPHSDESEEDEFVEDEEAVETESTEVEEEVVTPDEVN